MTDDHFAAIARRALDDMEDAGRGEHGPASPAIPAGFPGLDAAADARDFALAIRLAMAQAESCAKKFRPPREACGLLLRSRETAAVIYHACINQHPSPERAFRIDERIIAQCLGRGLIAVLHSHPGGGAAPSAADALAQRAMGIPWGIIPVLDGKAAEPQWSGLRR